MRIFLVPDVPVWQRYPPGAYEKQDKVNDFNVTALFLSCNIIHMYFPCPPPCHTIVSKSHLFPSLKNKGKCISSELPCKAAAYSSLFLCHLLPDPWVVVQFPKFVIFISLRLLWGCCVTPCGLQGAVMVQGRFAAVALGRPKSSPGYSWVLETSSDMAVMM